MSRRDEIEKAAKEIIQLESNYGPFIKGAEWADSNPTPMQMNLNPGRAVGHGARLISELEQQLQASKEREAKLVEALEKIANYDTLDGAKYVNHEQGFHGVAEFAQEVLSEIRGQKSE